MSTAKQLEILHWECIRAQHVYQDQARFAGYLWYGTTAMAASLVLIGTKKHHFLFPSLLASLGSTGYGSRVLDAKKQYGELETKVEIAKKDANGETLENLIREKKLLELSYPPSHEWMYQWHTKGRIASLTDM